jgi:hypothetical protein
LFFRNHYYYLGGAMNSCITVSDEATFEVYPFKTMRIEPKKYLCEIDQFTLLNNLLSEFVSGPNGATEFILETPYFKAKYCLKDPYEVIKNQKLEIGEFYLYVLYYIIIEICSQKNLEVYF